MPPPRGRSGPRPGPSAHPLDDVASYTSAASAASKPLRESNRTDDVCLNYQAGKCNLGARCQNYHPTRACPDELKRRGSCPRGIHCMFSHSPMDLHVQKNDSHTSHGPCVPCSSDASSSAPSDSKVCRHFQSGSCRRANCTFLHPNKPCKFEGTKKGSCKFGLNCRFSHQNPVDGSSSASSGRPNLKPVDITLKLRGNNLFWMKAANSAQLSRKLKGDAKKMKTLDEMGGMAEAKGVKLIRGSLGSDSADKSNKAKNTVHYTEPRTIRLTGPMEKVQEIQTMIEEQEALLEKLPKHEADWRFKDEPWAEELMRQRYHDITKIFNRKAHSAFAWWELIHENASEATGNKTKMAAAAKDQANMQIFSLAFCKIADIELQVAYTPNIVAAEYADAIIISCGPYMHMEDGVAQDITDWNTKSKQAAKTAMAKKYGHGPLPESQFVVVPIKDKNSSKKIFCSYIPPATADNSKNSQMMRCSMRNVLQHIAEHNNSASTKPQDKIKTIALPLLGTGRYGHCKDMAAHDILKEVMSQLPYSGVKRVQFLDQRVEPLEALKSAVKGLASQRGINSIKLSDLPVKELKVPGWYYYVGRDEAGGNHANAMRNSEGLHVIEDSDGSWFPLFPDVRERVEAAYQRYLNATSNAGSSHTGHAVPALPSGLPQNLQSPASATVSFNVDNIKYPDGMIYEISFDSTPMTQKNSKTGFKRKVTRKSKSYVWLKPDVNAIEKKLRSSAKKASSQEKSALAAVPAKQSGKVIGVLYQSLDKASGEDALHMAKAEIMSKFEVQSFCIPLPDHALSAAETAELNTMLSDIPVGLSVTTGAQSSSIKLSGLSPDLDKAKERIVESRIYVSNSKFAYPSTWDSTKAGQAEVVQVDSNSAEFHEVAAKFVKDLPGAKVSKVQRVQNDVLFKAYQGNFRIMHERYTINGMKLFKDSDLTKELWHGTGVTAPEVVVKSAFGTEKAYSSDLCMWGAGNYFSTTSKYSDNYAHKLTGSKNSKQMILFEVLTGLVFDSQPDNKLKKPPALPADHEVLAKFGASAPLNLQYDSVTGITRDTRVYITYSTGVAQQYPHYIVTYET